jgi:PPM family protein phosphatase
MLTVAEHAQKTDTGRQRHANEDAYFARAPVFAVADGMGGAQAGEVASRIAADAFDAELGSDGSPERRLRRVVEETNRRIHELAQSDQATAGMGTTLTALLVLDDEVTVAHVGDSRAYLFRDGKLSQLTSDHSLVEEMRKQGQLTDEEAEDHPQRSIITRALGPESSVKVDTRTLAARDRDVFLLCSDGLTTMVEDGRVAEILADARNLKAAVRELVGEANRKGGRDNITVVVFRLEEVDAPVADAPTLAGPTAESEGLSVESLRRAAARVAGVARRSEPEPEPPPPPPAPAPRRLRRALRGAIALLAVGAVCVGAFVGARQIHFLGVDEGGRVTLYRGLPYELPLGIEIYDERYSSPLMASELEPARRRIVTDHELRSRRDAVSVIEDLERKHGVGAP